MNKKGSIAVQILVMAVLVVVTSAVVLLLVNVGVLDVKTDANVDVLNAEFIPLSREGYLSIKDFQFCEFITDDFKCINPKDQFSIGDNVYFSFVVESTTTLGALDVVENYRLWGPKGNILLEVDEKDNYYFEKKSGKSLEEISIKDYLIIEEGDDLGAYTLSLVIVNPALNKQVTLSKTFEVVE